MLMYRGVSGEIIGSKAPFGSHGYSWAADLIPGYKDGILGGLREHSVAKPAFGV